MSARLAGSKKLYTGRSQHTYFSLNIDDVCRMHMPSKNTRTLCPASRRDSFFIFADFARNAAAGKALVRTGQGEYGGVLSGK